MPTVRRCAGCDGAFGLNNKALPRKFDWRGMRWWVFHNRDCKRKFLKKQQEARDRERAVRILFHPP